MSEWKYCMRIAYDGTDFSGWQVQPNAMSVQELLEKALTTSLREPVRPTGSGRTDAGVHARGQVAHFTASREVDLHRLLRSLNGLLPESVRVLKLARAPQEFHARYSATGKIYHYHICTDPVFDPFTRRYAWWIYDPLDLSLLNQAAQVFVGTHDFTSFANEPTKGSVSRNPVRTIWSIEVAPEPHGVCLIFKGEGFLYKMVRNLVGMATDVARGRRSLLNVKEILQARDRTLAARAAPAHGLFLHEVLYPELFI